MKKDRFLISLCCLGAALSALLPWGVLRWGESLIGHPFFLPEITYTSPEISVVGEAAADMEQILHLLEKGTRKLVTTMEVDAVGMDASALLADLQQEIEELQGREILSDGVYHTQSAVLARWSASEGKQTDLWEFTLSTEGETALLRYHADSGRVLFVQRTLGAEMPPTLPEEALEGWSGYLTDSALPGLPRVRVAENTIFLSISPL